MNTPPSVQPGGDIPIRRQSSKVNGETALERGRTGLVRLGPAAMLRSAWGAGGCGHDHDADRVAADGDRLYRRPDAAVPGAVGLGNGADTAVGPVPLLAGRRLHRRRGPRIEAG